MIHITYTPDNADLAGKMQTDLADNPMRLENHVLVVLVSPAAATDDGVLQAIKTAERENHLIVPVMVAQAPLPDSIAHMKALDLTGGYDRQKVLAFIKRADIGDTVIASNRRMLGYIGAVVGIVFVVSIWALVTGRVAPPTEEYQTENAIRNEQIQTLTFPTLDAFLPRTTQDALDFPMTVEAASTRNAPLLAATATALPQSIRATESARETAIVATSTARAEATATQAASEE